MGCKAETVLGSKGFTYRGLLGLEDVSQLVSCTPVDQAAVDLPRGAWGGSQIVPIVCM